MTCGTSRPEIAADAGAWRDAQRYDEWFETRWGRYAFGRESRTVSRAAGVGRGALVVDVGCGTARFTDPLSAAGAWALGIEPESAMITCARDRTTGPLVAADALALPLCDDSVDVALAITVLEFVSDPAEAMAEMARVVRPGGRIVVGALNPRSAWGLAHRHELAEPPWRAARFLARAELRALGRRHGRVELRSALYAPSAVPFLGLVGPLLEGLGHAVPAWGAFQVLVVHTDGVAVAPRRPAGVDARDSGGAAHGQ